MQGTHMTLIGDAPDTSAQCADCRLPYADFGLDVVLPRAQWLLINPEDRGVLCAMCIVKRARQVKGCTVIHAVLEIAPCAHHATVTAHWGPVP